MVLPLDNNCKTIFLQRYHPTNGVALGRYFSYQVLLAGGLGLGSCLGEGLINRVVAKPKTAESQEIAADRFFEMRPRRAGVSARFAYAPVCQNL